MRNINTILYKYNELPTEAKKYAYEYRLENCLSMFSYYYCDGGYAKSVWTDTGIDVAWDNLYEYVTERGYFSYDTKMKEALVRCIEAYSPYSVEKVLDKFEYTVDGRVYSRQM